MHGWKIELYFYVILFIYMRFKNEEKNDYRDMGMELLFILVLSIVGISFCWNRHLYERYNLCCRFLRYRNNRLVFGVSL